MSVQPVGGLRQSDSTQDSGAGKRPSLKALPKVRRRQRGMIAGAIVLLAAALAAVLGVNIHVANSQYQVVQMQNEHRTLVQQNQALTQQVQHRESPQTLADSAVGLGLVMPAAAGTIDAATGEVVSEGEAAERGDQPTSFVDAAAAPGGEPAASTDVSEYAAEAPSGLLGTGALNTLSHGPTSDNDQGEQDLHEGHIPAPSLSN
ncbi:hypothetical protein [Nesterenkonia populi]|uniref:hypothetical protein n=1 Tax=Nesterenkonia populi TaxID=1591087 RepID=UPI0011BF7DDA|nr:hypothetical protein [Nesterenkonia populi]